MKVVALVSGGKDSVYSMMKCVEYGHEIVCLATLQPPKSNSEVDSFMFQSIGTHVVEHIAECMELPWVAHTLQGKSISTDMGYSAMEGDEVEDLCCLLQEVQKRFPEVQAVSTGAIFSNYQRTRVEHICARLNLISLAYLWRRPQDELMQEMIEADINAILVKVASMGLVPRRHLGRTIADLYPFFLDLNEKYQFHICGEGGEYETLTLDCPLFKKRIVIDSAQIHLHSDDMIAPVGLYCIDTLHLEPKDSVEDVAKTSFRAFTPVFPCRPLAKKHTISVSTKRSHVFRDQIVLSGVVSKNVSLTLAEQVHNVCQQLQDTLVGHDLSLPSVAFVHVYVKDMATFGAVNEIFAKYFPCHNPPSRSCIEVNMAEDVMMDCWAIRNSTKRKTLHVASISDWAPTCIGPYCQANVLNSSLILSAGQIPLVPATMQMAAQEHLPQCLNNVLGVLEALESNLRHVIAGILYTIEPQDSLADETQLLLNANLHHRDAYESDDDDSLDEDDINEKSISTQVQVPLLCITVAALPRQAPLEVEFLALTHQAMNLFNPQSFQFQDDAFNSEWTIVPRMLCVGYCYLSSSLQLLDASSLRSHVLRVLGKANLVWKSLLHMRVYHVENSPDLTSLNVPMTFVPTHHISHKSSAVSVAIQVVAYDGELMETDLWLARKI
ncbi:hypothetical protein AeNC1_007666 [Aphanomyces euteiches]|nr:hypothetical protein AeNC1_007666 [Aphanomyces euteiches]